MARPRNPAIDDAILDAVRHLLAEDGYAALTIEAVAEHAGVGRPTVYRRWPSRAALAAAALQTGAASPRGGSGDATPPDTGSLRGDLNALVDRLIVGFSSMEATGGAMGGIVAEMALNPEFSNEFRRRWLDPDQAALAVVFERATNRGEAVPADGPAVLGHLAGTVLYHLVVLHQPCPPAWRIALVDLILLGLEPRLDAPGR